MRDLYKMQNKQHKLVSGTKKQFYQEQINTAENPITKTKASNTALNVDGYEERNPQNIANNFNKVFQEAPSKVINNIQKDSEFKQDFVTNTSSIYLRPVTESELEGILKHKLKNKRSSGFDDISGYIIKKIYNLLIPVLTYLVNLTFCEGQFSTILKINTVIPIYKRGDSLLAENYSPVALISVFSKVLEYAFLSRLQSFFDSRNILSPNRFGFRRD